jgi:hypothetical protein
MLIKSNNDVFLNDARTVGDRTVWLKSSNHFRKARPAVLTHQVMAWQAYKPKSSVTAELAKVSTLDLSSFFQQSLPSFSWRLILQLLPPCFLLSHHS